MICVLVQHIVNTPLFSKYWLLLLLGQESRKGEKKGEVRGTEKNDG